MDKFWAQAAKVLKPGGTVAVWTCCECFVSTGLLFSYYYYCATDSLLILV